MLAPLATTKTHSVEILAEMMNRDGFPPPEGAHADYRYSELIDVILMVDPDARFLWLQREARDTVVSMVRKRWFHPSEDTHWPIAFARWQDDGLWLTNWVGGWRTTAALVGEVSWREWHSWDQVDRCLWWVRWCNDMLFDSLNRLPADRWAAIKLENGQVPSEVCSWVGAKGPLDILKVTD